MGAAAFQKGLGGVHAIAGKSKVIARLLNIPTHRFDGLLAWVLELRSRLGIAHSLADIGVDLRNFKVIGAEATRDPSAGGNPIPVDAAALENFFRAAVAGDLEAIG
jgi:alcohol dehydrogenase class IV